MSYKIPFFSPLKTIDSIYEWFQLYFGRIASTDLVLSTVVAIGIWDMQSDSSVTVNYPLNLSIKRIVGITVSIINDAGDTIYEASLTGGFDSVYVNAIAIFLNRKSGGIFDSSDFNSSVLSSRGNVTIWYTT